MPTKKKTALVLSGGGALGAAHIGVIKKLEEKNYEFDFLAGVSAGSIICALLAIGKNSTQIKKILEDTKFFSLIFDFSNQNFGLIRGEKVYKMLENIFGDTRFKDIKTPLYIGATDFQTGEKVIINSGKIIDAVRASISVPIIFDPFFHPKLKKWLSDGGLSLNCPTDIAIKKYKGNQIYAVDVAGSFPKDIDFSEKNYFKKLTTLRQTLERSFRIIFYNQQCCIPQDKRVKIIRPDLRDFSAWKISGMNKIIQKGEDAME